MVSPPPSSSKGGLPTWVSRSTLVLYGQEVDFSREDGISDLKSDMNEDFQGLITSYDILAFYPFAMTKLYSSAVLYLFSKALPVLNFVFIWGLAISLSCSLGDVL